MSYLSTMTMLDTEKTLKALTNVGVTAKIIIGGVLVTQNYADKIDAGGYNVKLVAVVGLAQRFVV